MEEVEIKHFLKQIPLKKEVKNFLKLILKILQAFQEK